mmetsp:Transcript_48146/g.127486  ORF Transcript_48146/g.127486 Transcript_48146/m.127486 type:complete len:219 (+) Transcript_48146:105-761(+)
MMVDAAGEFHPSLQRRSPPLLSCRCAEDALKFRHRPRSQISTVEFRLKVHRTPCRVETCPPQSSGTMKRCRLQHDLEILGHDHGGEALFQQLRQRRKLPPMAQAKDPQQGFCGGRRLSSLTCGQATSVQQPHEGSHGRSGLFHAHLSRWGVSYTSVPFPHGRTQHCLEHGRRFLEHVRVHTNPLAIAGDDSQVPLQVASMQRALPEVHNSLGHMHSPS